MQSIIDVDFTDDRRDGKDFDFPKKKKNACMYNRGCVLRRQLLIQLKM